MFVTLQTHDGNFFLQVRIARIFNTYGPRMCLDDGRVVSNFVAQVNHLSSLHFHSYISSNGLLLEHLQDLGHE